jgi:hypothetical protein
MASVPKPLLALLAAAIAGFAVWTVALKKPVTGGSGSSPAATVPPSAVAKAHQAAAAAASAKASAAHGASVSSPAAPATHASGGAAPTPAKHAAATHESAAKTHSAAKAPAKQPLAKAATSSVSEGSVLKAIADHKVVALLFFNPSASDDNAVNRELSGISTHGGAVAKFAVPVTQLAKFNAVTARVPVTTSPTLLVIDKHGQTTTLTGFIDQLELAQRVSVALSGK